jgi:uncharacterized protein (TIGR00251 family)
MDVTFKVIPRSSRNEFVGTVGDTIKVKVTAPPLEGQANKALIALIAKKLGIPRGNIEIISGKRSRLKTVRIYGLPPEEVTSILLM